MGRPLRRAHAYGAAKEARKRCDVVALAAMLSSQEPESRAEAATELGRLACPSGTVRRLAQMAQTG
jgi:hypothetical protein